MNLDFIAIPLGQFLNFIYNSMALKNYGLAIIIFTIFIKIILLPLTIKQYKSTAHMQQVQPQIQEIQKRYKSDPEKMNQELMKVYKENKINPAGGCLPLLIQMPILFALYWVISSPLRYMRGISKEAIEALYGFIPDTAVRIISNKDVSIINYFQNNSDKLSQVSDMLKLEDLINFNFFGLNLGMQPSFDVGKISTLGSQFFLLLLIPIFAALTTFIQMKVAAPQQKGGNDMAASMTKSMTLTMPLMTAFFAFSVPAGLGLYWIISNTIQIIQQLFINKYIFKKKEASSN